MGPAVLLDSKTNKEESATAAISHKIDVHFRFSDQQRILPASIAALAILLFLCLAIRVFGRKLNSHRNKKNRIFHYINLFRLRKYSSQTHDDTTTGHAPSFFEYANSYARTPIRKSRSSGFVPLTSLATRKLSRPTSLGTGIFMDVSSDTERDGDASSDTEQTFYTEHERFANAYQNTIRYSDYRRLVLPPVCKLLDPSKIKKRQAESCNRSSNAANAAWIKLVDDFHRIISFDYPGYLVLFNIRMFKALQYRWTKMWGGKIMEEEEEDDDDNTVASNASRRSALSKEESVSGSVAEVNCQSQNANHLGHDQIQDQNVSYSKDGNILDHVDGTVPTSPLHLQELSSSLNDCGIVSSPVRNEKISVMQFGLESECKGRDVSIVKQRERFYTGNDCELDPKLFERSPGRLSPKRQINNTKYGESFDISVHSSLELLPEDASEDEWLPLNHRVTQEAITDDGSLNPPQDMFDLKQNGVVESNVDTCVPLTPDCCGLGIGLPQATSELGPPSPIRTLDSLAIPTLPRKISSHGVKQKDNLEKYRNTSSKFVIQPHPNAIEVVEAAGRPTLDQKSQSHEMVYFDTATNDASMRQLERIAPMPDREGYILGDQFLEDPRDTPLLVFVNTRSGSQQGPILKTQLRRLLNPIQIWDLADGGPEKILKSFSVFTRLRLLVCGGDGTVSWIISTLDKMKLDRWPPIAILPLGTGNDLARIHGWGAGYANESLLMILDQVKESYISLLDRWTLTIEERKKKKSKKKRISSKPFINYMSIGMDALSALQVHNLRENSPNMFFSRAVNKIWYALFGAEDAIKASCSDLPKQIILEADGVKIPIPKDSQGLIFLNIDSYLGGVPLWSRGVPILKRRSRQRRERRYSEGDFLGVSDNEFFGNRKRLRSYDESDSIACDSSIVEGDRVQETYQEKLERIMACNTPSSCQDGKLDVISHRGNFNLGQIRVGLTNAQRLCQCSTVKITMKKSLAVQVDGEPWKQDSGVLTIERQKEPAMMLHRALEEGGGIETEVANLLEWAEEKKIIERDVHALLMKEFSRRIEKKTRARRNKTQQTVFANMKRRIASSHRFPSVSD